MRGSLRAEEAMEATGMLAQRFERSVSFDKAQDERKIEPVMVSLRTIERFERFERADPHDEPPHPGRSGTRAALEPWNVWNRR